MFLFVCLFVYQFERGILIIGLLRTDLLSKRTILCSRKPVCEDRAHSALL